MACRGIKAVIYMARQRNRIAEARQHTGWTQAELAERVGLERSSIAHIERGSNPTLANAQRLALALGAPLDWLFPPDTMNPTQAD